MTKKSAKRDFDNVVLRRIKKEMTGPRVATSAREPDADQVASENGAGIAPVPSRAQSSARAKR
jgi:hypothetical protein